MAHELDVTAGFSGRRLLLAAEEDQPQVWIAERTPQHRLEFVAGRPPQRLPDQLLHGTRREELSSDQRREEAVPQRRSSAHDAPLDELREVRLRRVQGPEELEGDLKRKEQQRDGRADG